MSEEKLIDHVVSRLEPQILDYVEVRHPRNTANLLQIVDKYEERFMHRQIRDRKMGGKTEIMRDTPIIADHKGNLIGSKTKVSQIIADSRVDAKVDNRINHSTVKAVDKVGREIVHFEVKMNEVEIKLLSDRCEYGGNRSRGTENPPVWDHRPIRVSSIRMTPVELPYVPILLNETFITALWDTGAEKSFISEEVYRNYFSYRPRQKTKDKVVTAQGAPCSHLGRVELQIRIREFQKP
ncbi:uncharacterized protein TNCV_2703101 [Trichonephila clavipes]|nr:uncharacterized protein TNCV_2703101 [Trichonephila clavipes]